MDGDVEWWISWWRGEEVGSDSDIWLPLGRNCALLSHVSDMEGILGVEV